ncbi:uncharacterized protein LOC126821118 [Patella vulgata]|uniref:uncharacterized protein LOC126821118 n=1 Tax=Patella vulgata TaxID=6465 RepID=UPI0021802A45|nr:uncharacterized protein LOC126821118 [Patella vulgata]XP_050405406.1 uncharacterized protein LOC126821118 [Patella vulgata]
MPRNRRSQKYISMPPYSREAEYKYILGVVHNVLNEVKEFHKYYVQGVKIDYSACTGCLDKLLDDWERDKSYLITWRDYMDMLKHNAVDRKLKESDEFADIRFICERTSHFEGTFDELVNKLISCVHDHLYRYCISFQTATKGVEIATVKGYEEDITRYRTDLDTQFNEVADNLNQYGETLTPFYDLVSIGNEHGSIMENICHVLIDICGTVKSWIKKDRGYSDRIWQEMQTYMSNRDQLREEESKTIKQRDDVLKKLDQLEKQKKEVIKNYEKHKKEKVKLRNRIEVVEYKISRLEVTVDRKEEAFEKTKEYRSLDNPLTPRKQITYNNTLEKLLREIEELDLQVDPTQKHMETLKKELKATTHTTYELKVEAATLDNDQHDIRKELPDLNIQLESTREGIAANNNKIKAMEKIRNYIALAGTLRKLHRDEELEKPNSENDNNLTEALQIVAQNLGRDWRKVYPKLPFTPPREQWKKHKDIQILDMVAMRCDHTHEEQALKAFEKWLTFNRRGNLRQLIRTLRKSQKVDLANELEERYMVENVY